MAVTFSVPAYAPDVLSGEVIAGYNIQSSPPVAGVPQPYGPWTTVTGSPFASNQNILDPSGTGTQSTYYRVQPIRQVTVSGTVYTLDSPWSKPFYPSTTLYDSVFTKGLLPILRFTYLGDEGIAQTNGTNLQETTGAGSGQWVFDGTTTRFQLQYVMNDDPIRILDGIYQMTYSKAGTPTALLPDVDYTVDSRAGVVQFKTAPAATDYARFDFRKVDFVNEDLLMGLASAVNALSTFGKNGFQTVPVQNVQTINQILPNPDIAEIICRLAIFLMREGQIERDLRNSMAWRDGPASVDPFPSRGLEFIVGKWQISEDSLRRAINTYIRGTTAPRGRGEFERFFDLSQLTPLVSGMFGSMTNGIGVIGAGIGTPSFYPFYCA